MLMPKNDSAFESGREDRGVLDRRSNQSIQYQSSALAVNRWAGNQYLANYARLTSPRSILMLRGGSARKRCGTDDRGWDVEIHEWTCRHGVWGRFRELWRNGRGLGAVIHGCASLHTTRSLNQLELAWVSSLLNREGRPLQDPSREIVPPRHVYVSTQ